MSFPAAIWTPVTREYFSAAAPDGSILHGSGQLKRFQDNPRVYGATWSAQWLREVYRRSAAGRLPAEGLALLEALEPTAAMVYGSAVEHFAFPAAGDPVPDVSLRIRQKARLRAGQIRSHPEAGRYITAEGAVFQVAHRWRDPASDLWLRMRLDCVYYTVNGPGELDLKIWSDCPGHRIKWKIRDHGADLQGAIYRRGQLDLWGLKLPRTLIIAGPGLRDKIFVRKLPEAMLQKADDHLSFLLDRLALSYQTCVFTDPEECPQEVAA